MAKLNGYKTFLFGLFVLLGGVTGKHLAPGLVDQYSDVILAAIGVAIIMLRMVTSSPIFGAVAADVGLPAQAAAEIKHFALELPDLGGIGPSLASLHAKVDALASAPVSAPPSPPSPTDPSQPQDDAQHAVARTDGEGGVMPVVAKAWPCCC